jgi:cytochrome c oxidase assembly protein subunit 11
VSANARERKAGATPLKLAAVTIGMFGFGFALVPLYDVFCEITGLNGKTGVVDAAQVASYAPDESREITVEFVATLNQGLGWDFEPVVTKMTVHPGKVYTTSYVATNLYEQAMVGQAVPGEMPNLASRFFNKTECFCFVNQQFEAGERRSMPVAFVIDPSIPDNVRTVTLSYTFFNVTEQAALAAGR